MLLYADTEAHEDGLQKRRRVTARVVVADVLSPPRIAKPPAPTTTASMTVEQESPRSSLPRHQRPYKGNQVFF